MTAHQPDAHGSADEIGGRNHARARSMEALGGLPAVAPTFGQARGRISDLVYHELSEAIRDLRLTPGAALSEPAVAASLNVSRAPVREAFTRLADQGLVTIVPQVGSQVAPISMGAVSDAVFIRRALEKSAFQQAISFDDLDLSELQDVVERNRDAFERRDLERFFQTDEQLHQIVFGLGGVPRIWDVVRGAKVHLDRLRRLNLDGAIANAEIPAEHQAIVDAIAARDETTGLRVIHRHSSRIITDTEKLRVEYPDYFVA